MRLTGEQFLEKMGTWVEHDGWQGTQDNDNIRKDIKPRSPIKTETSRNMSKAQTPDNEGSRTKRKTPWQNLKSADLRFFGQVAEKVAMGGSSGSYSGVSPQATAGTGGTPSAGVSHPKPPSQSGARIPMAPMTNAVVPPPAPGITREAGLVERYLKHAAGVAGRKIGAPSGLEAGLSTTPVKPKAPPVAPKGNSRIGTV